MPPSEQKISPSGDPSMRRFARAGFDAPGIATRILAAVTHGAKTSSPPTLIYAPGMESGVHPPVPAHGRRLTDLRITLPEESEVVSTQCVGTRPPEALSSCTVAQPRSVHGRVPRFQMPSAMTKLPAAPPPSPGETAICNCEPAQLGSPAVTMAGVGEGVGDVVSAAVGEERGDALGAGEEAKGVGVPTAGLWWTLGVPEHEASSTDASTAKLAGSLRDAAFAKPAER